MVLALTTGHANITSSRCCVSIAALESDIDFFVEFLEPRFDWLASLHDYMEGKFNKKIEIVRKRNLAESDFFERVEKEIIYA